MIQLERYKGTKSRHSCPSCGTRNCFARYTDENGDYLADDVGRCDRESKCGYHYKPKQYFADHAPANTNRGAKEKKRTIPNYGFANKNTSEVTNKPDFIPFDHFKATLGNYNRNAFVQFLLNLFPDCAEEVQDAIKNYFVGTYDTYTCFPSIDRANRICRAKLIRFNPATGKRLKGEYDKPSSLVRKLKLKEDFQYKQIFFGEHLLSKYPNKPVAIVEAEKTAIIASLCFPEFVWLSCNSKTWLKVERLQTLGQRRILLYPDADGFDLWRSIALEAQTKGLTVKVSNLIENHATIEQKANGFDLADYLIFQQKEINQRNKSIDTYNLQLEMVLNDETLFSDFETMLNEQKAIRIIDAGLSEIETEKQIIYTENLRQIVNILATN